MVLSLGLVPALPLRAAGLADTPVRAPEIPSTTRAGLLAAADAAVAAGDLQLARCHWRFVDQPQGSSGGLSAARLGYEKPATRSDLHGD